jgi:hypothetical protein
MSDVLFDRERAALAELWRLIEERRNGEAELTASAAQAEQGAINEGEEARQSLVESQERELARLDAAAHRESEDLKRRLSAEEAAAQRSFSDTRKRLEAEETKERGRIDQALKDALWIADSVSEGGQKRLKEHLDTTRRRVATGETRSEEVWAEVESLLARVGLERDDVEPEGKVDRPAGETPAEHGTLLARAEAMPHTMRQMSLLRWMSWPRLVSVGLVAVAAGCVPALWLRPLYLWLLGGALAGFLVTAGIREILYVLARRRLGDLAEEFALLLAKARVLGTELVAQTEAACAVERTDLNNKYILERQQAQAVHKPLLEELLRRYGDARKTVEQQFQAAAPPRRKKARESLEAIGRRQKEDRARCVSRQETARRDAEADHAARLRKLEQDRTEQDRQLRERWETAAAALLAEFGEFRRLGEAAAPGSGPGVSLPYGTLTLDVEQLAGDMGVEKLAPLPPTPLVLPAFLPFPRLGGLLFQAFGQGRTVAVQVLQALMLRFLTSLPPGKVRFTILDPVGLGDNFSAFMHLADHDEALVSSRIWTEPAHIEKQLADLTGHMENVIQKYLRRQFSSIEDYNAQAGEVAEPYRVLVVANFPVNFTPQAARRLVSLVQSGSSCGVYALIGLDSRQPLPQGFNVEDLEQHCLTLFWREDRFRLVDAELDRYPLALAMPPEPERVVEEVRRVGALSRDANRVRVPFSFIAPAESEFWKGDSRRGLMVPLGRAGAVRRLELQLGQGTSQHVLVAGKTGSGKSTLWHALITNLALLYSPDEVELFLIDFKKGVEFKAYALHQLPHARVIAVESEREFGLSVLQRLDAELRQRGDLFRAAAVNDIAGYRQGDPSRHCPRILLIVDEFQEFFVEDDKLSQEAALLLDRLVRQGRAFGLHVLLGSQTLGGAYSLARSTIDQMAVRIALQCSEADAQLILDKDNSAARLLSRPGEAIYNDTNGAVEGNEVFQVVWLPEEEREEVLVSVRSRAAELLPEAARRPPLVFEGNTPAELQNNPLLRLRIADCGSRVEQNGETAIRSPQSAIGRAWLGEPIAIKDPTAAVFRAQTGNALLIVGQHEEAALALLTSAVVSLAVQQPTAQFVVLDSTAAHEPNAGYLQEVMRGWPRPVTLPESGGVAAALAGLAEEMNQRLKGTPAECGPRYLLINGLQRYREFRRSDDDLGFGRRGAERTVSPLEHLQALLRDGPAVGIHLLIWCDSQANVMRSLDRAGLRECGQRVLFQMSAADSSHLLDTPLASRLGRNRALFATDEMAQPEKFRPYGLPSLTWLAEVKRRLAERAESPALVSDRVG